MKVLGVNDLRSRIYPKLTEFMALNGDYSWSVRAGSFLIKYSRKEGDDMV